MFGINPGEFAVLLLVALIVVGPERLPRYAQQLGRLVREGRKMAMGLREQVRGELGPEFDDVDWTKLDPRQYDPRKIIRDALSDTLDDEPKAVTKGGPTPAASEAPPVEKPTPEARPGSAASPMAAAGTGATVAAAAAPGSPRPKRPSTRTADAGGAAATSSADYEVHGTAEQSDQGEQDGHHQPEQHSVPAARTAGGAPVDLEAT